MRVTLIAALAIPTSIIGTFTVMKAFGFTLNNMTMLALSLATGIVIDDAIVVLENIFRYIEEKKVSPHGGGEGGHEGNRPRRHGHDAVAGGHLPARRLHDRAGGPLLLQLRHHVGGGDPDLDVRLLHADAGAVRRVAAPDGRRAGGHQETKQRGVLRLDRPALRPDARVVAAPPGRMLAIAGVVVRSAVVLFPFVGKELVPDDDQSEFSVNVRLPRGTSFLRTDEYIRPIEADLREELPEVVSVLTSVGAGNANFYVGLTAARSSGTCPSRT